MFESRKAAAAAFLVGASGSVFATIPNDPLQFLDLPLTGFPTKSFRLQAFGLHLLASTALLSLVLVVFYFGWYAWPGWYLAGAELVVGLMVLVNIGVGPLATLVVANPDKPRRKLRGDIGLIFLVQLATLGYGAKTLWDGRPLYYAFSGDQVELVPAIAVAPEDIQIARSRQLTLAPEWYSRPRWVWARLPEDPEEFRRLLPDLLLGGKDVAAMPQYLHPLSEASAAMRSFYVPIRSLLHAPGMDDAEYARRLASLGKAEDALAVLPVVGRAREGAMIFDRVTGEPLAYWRVKVHRSAAKSN